MDEFPMGRVFDADGFAGSEPLEEASSGGLRARLAGVPWRSYTRCFFLAAVMAGVGIIAFRPGMLRLSILLSMVSPSRGDSLAWTPEDGEWSGEAGRLPPARYTAPVEEWRLSAGGGGGWFGERPASGSGEGWLGGEVGVFPWKRDSFNPWSWSDDAARAAARMEVPDEDPVQKPASLFRTKDTDGWASVPSPGTAGTSGAQGTAETRGEAFAGAGRERVPTIAALSPLPAAAPLELPSTALSLPPLAPPASPAPPSPVRPPEAPAAPEAAESPDWKEREIAAPIPGAYLTIYPKLKFIGLCVPGQGYIRKYNQIAVPSDLTSPKQSADDGRTPYGKYFVVSHSRGGDSGPRLLLSWPSTDDARRAGADSDALAAVERAWQRRELPPQDTAAGGGLVLSGERDRGDWTRGGFNLEPPSMEEIFTALPDGAWVFVQQ